jgi:Uncharacterized protein conserved in bacteria (DUF2252)
MQRIGGSPRSRSIFRWHTAKLYARYCGRVLVRAHCRTGDAVLLSAYMGDSDAFEKAIPISA